MTNSDFLKIINVLRELFPHYTVGVDDENKGTYTITIRDTLPFYSRSENFICYIKILESFRGKGRFFMSFTDIELRTKSSIYCRLDDGGFTFAEPYKIGNR